MPVPEYIRRYANWVSWPSLATPIKATDLDHFEDTFEAHADELIALESSVSTNTTNISTLDGRLDTVEPALTTAQGDLGALSQAIADERLLFHDSGEIGSTQASFDVSSIPASHRDMEIVAYLRTTGAGSLINTNMRFNNDSDSDYHSHWYDVRDADDNDSVEMSHLSGESLNLMRVGYMPAASSGTGSFGYFRIYVPAYASSKVKLFISHSVAMGHASSFSVFHRAEASGVYMATDAINRVTVFPNEGNMAIGSRFLIYLVGAL